MLTRKINFFRKLSLCGRIRPDSLLPKRKTAREFAEKRFLDVLAVSLYYAPIDFALATGCAEQSKAVKTRMHVTSSAFLLRPPRSNFY